jgi:uncharacterized membrane protein
MIDKKMEKNKAISKRTVILLLICVIALAASVRLYGLDRQSLWYDEVSEETAFQRQFLNMGGKIPLNPPLHLFFIYPVTKIFPGNDFALRMVPFTFGLISVPLLFLLGLKMFNERTGLIAAFLLAISPFHIWYSQEARMYALQWMLALISLIYFLRTLEQPRRGHYIGYILSTSAGLYTLQLTVFLLIIQALYILLFFRKYKTQFFKWVGAFGLIVVSYLPYIIFTVTSFERMKSFPKHIDFLNAIPYTIYSYFAGFSIGPSLRELHFSQHLTTIMPYITVIGLLMVLHCSLSVFGLLSVRKDRSILILLLLLITVPILGVAVISNVVPTVTFNVRYTGIALFGFLLSNAKGVDWLTCLKSKIPGKIVAIFALVAITGFSAYSYANYQFDIKYHKSDLRGAAHYVRDNRAEGDLALCINSEPMFNRYSEKAHYCIGPYANPKNKEAVEAELKRMVKGKKRLWVVINHKWFRPELINYTMAWLNTNYKEIPRLHKDISEIANLYIHCYDLTAKPTIQNK